MARVGQTTPTSGRSYVIGDAQGPVRRVSVGAPFSPNLIGFFGYESAVAGNNSARAALVDSAGVPVAISNILPNAASTVGTPTEIQITFPSGLTLPAGDYELVLLGYNDGSVESNLLVVGQNADGTGLPVTWFRYPGDWPNFPNPMTPHYDTGVPREWAIYLDYTEVSGSTAPSITSIDDSTLSNGQTNVTITGTGFGATRGSGNVIIAQTNSAIGTNATPQTITSWSDTSITFTVVRGALPWDDSCFLFVRNNDNEANASGLVVSFVPRVFINETLAGLDNTPVSATGITALVYRTLPTASSPNPNSGDVFENISTTGSLRLELSRGSLSDGDYVLLFLADADPRAAGARFVQVDFE